MKLTSRSHRRASLISLLAAAVVAGLLSTANAQTPAPAIQLLNPSGHSVLISDKGRSFHLTAWGSGLSTTSLVEFEIQSAGNPTVTIGTAARAGTDTFELYWDIPGSLANGAYTLRAILYSGSPGSFQEVSRDEQVVRLNHLSDPTNAASETAELTYPTSAGNAGIFTPPGGPPHMIADAVSSAGATQARALYTTSLPGTEPQWKICGTETAAQAGDGVRCKLVAPDTSSSVTAIAIVANTTPVAPNVPYNDGLNQSGDAHRIFGYKQNPTSMVLAPKTQRVDPLATGTFPCSETITATITDQLNRKIAGANVDVYAQGPSDQLAFDTSASAGTQAPDQNQVGAPEPAFNCPNSTFGGFQTERNLPGEADIKHIESVSGTNDAGQFGFKLRTDGAGTTAITAWADADGNDLFCAMEASDSAAIGWNQDSATPTALPSDTADCSSATPSPSPSGTPGPVSRQITLGSSNNRPTWSKTFALSGTVSAATGSTCGEVASVSILRQVTGSDDSYRPVVTVVTNADGSFNVNRVADRSATYLATVEATAVCGAAESPPTQVLVAKKVTLKIQGSGLVARVSPCGAHAGDRVRLERRVDGNFTPVATKRSNDDCVAKFTAGTAGTYRAVALKQDADHLGGASNKVTI